VRACVIPSFHLGTQGLYELFPSDSISGSVFDLVPGLSCNFVSFSTVLLHVTFCLPYPWLPCILQSRASRVISLGSLQSIWHTAFFFKYCILITSYLHKLGGVGHYVVTVCVLSIVHGCLSVVT
jgi:hypothetical protein